MLYSVEQTSTITANIQPLHIEMATRDFDGLPISGLSSFVYTDQNMRAVPLLDRDRHIYYIHNETIGIVQRLINLCLDAKNEFEFINQNFNKYSRFISYSYGFVISFIDINRLVSIEFERFFNINILD